MFSWRNKKKYPHILVNPSSAERDIPCLYKHRFRSVGFLRSLPALVAQLDACLTGDQEVAGLTPRQVGNILSWRFVHIFSMVILSLLLIEEGQLSVSGGRMYTILVNH